MEELINIGSPAQSRIISGISALHNTDAVDQRTVLLHASRIAHGIRGNRVLPRATVRRVSIGEEDDNLLGALTRTSQTTLAVQDALCLMQTVVCPSGSFAMQTIDRVLERRCTVGRIRRKIGNHLRAVVAIPSEIITDVVIFITCKLHQRDAVLLARVRNTVVQRSNRIYKGVRRSLQRLHLIDTLARVELRMSRVTVISRRLRREDAVDGIPPIAGIVTPAAAPDIIQFVPFSVVLNIVRTGGALRIRLRVRIAHVITPAVVHRARGVNHENDVKRSRGGSRRFQVRRGGQRRQANQEVGVALLDGLTVQSLTALERVVAVEHAFVGPDATDVLRGGYTTGIGEVLPRTRSVGVNLRGRFSNGNARWQRHRERQHACEQERRSSADDAAALSN